MNNIIKHLSLLHSQELYSNIIKLAELTVTICDQKPDFSPTPLKFQLYIYYAEAQFQLEQYAAAEKNYSQALQMRKVMLKIKTSSAKNIDEKDLMSDVDIKFKIYQCCMKLKQTRKAVDILESIPARNRTAKVNMALGNLYRDIGKDRAAITCYKEILKECPLALEAAENLLKLDVKGVEVNALMVDVTMDIAWINIWLRAQTQMYARDYANAVMLFKSLDVTGLLKDNVALLVNLGYCYNYMCNDSAAIANLQRALRLDPNLKTGRDLLACLLANSGEKEHLKDLEKILTPELDMSLWSHENWTVMGYYMYAHKKYERANYFAQQACNLNGKSVEPLLLTAAVNMQINKYYEASVNYREALMYCPYRFDVHKGLVHSYLAMNKLREAITVANNACKQLNHNPPTLTLYASVLLKDPLSISKVRGVLEKAINADPPYLPAIYLFAEYLEQEQQYIEATALLKKYVDICSSSKLHQLLADCCVRLERNEEAFHHYNIALRLDPNNQRALEGLDSIGRSITSSKLDSTCYITARGESNAYPSQAATTSDHEGDPDSDTDNWPNNSSDIMAFSV